MNQRPLRVLLIEDDPDYFEIVRLCLAEPDSMGLSFEITRFETLAAGIDGLAAGGNDALLLDLNLPDSRGLETFMTVLARGFELPVLVMTNAGDEAMALEAMRLGAQDYMVKSTTDSRILKRAIWYAVERSKVLAQSESLLRRSADGIVVVDHAGIVQSVNPSAEQILGTPAQELLGRPFPHPVAPGQTSQIKLPPLAGEPRSAELRVVEIQWRDSPALLASIRDITELQKLEQLKAQIREQRKVDQLKDELIATVSHEFRTPLTIVKGALDNLREEIAGPMLPKQREVLGLAERNLTRLSKMINNLLGLSRLESGRSKPSRRRLLAQPLLEEAVVGFQLTAKEKGVALGQDFAEALGEVDVDPEMIAEVLNNLIDNALRFARGRVLVSARRVASADEAGLRDAPSRDPDRGGVVVEVLDDGPGVPTDRQQDLFNKFVQVNRSLAGPGYKGTGLGLAICKEIMALHGSRIRLDSSPEAGARFSFLLPGYSAGRAETPKNPPEKARR